PSWFQYSRCSALVVTPRTLRARQVVPSARSRVRAAPKRVATSSQCTSSQNASALVVHLLDDGPLADRSSSFGCLPVVARGTRARHYPRCRCRRTVVGAST